VNLQRTREAIRDCLNVGASDFSVTLGVTLAINEAAYLANKVRFKSLKLGATPRETYDAALREAITTLQLLLQVDDDATLPELPDPAGGGGVFFRDGNPERSPPAGRPDLPLP
jgi:hypothetical protein